MVGLVLECLSLLKGAIIFGFGWLRKIQNAEHNESYNFLCQVFLDCFVSIILFMMVCRWF